MVLGMSHETNSSTVWPRSGDRCEPNLPWVGEIWSASTALMIIAAGLIPLFTSRHSDQLVDLISATVALNGVFSALSHSTLLTIFGRADMLSINLAVLLYIKLSIMTHSPELHEKPISRGTLSLLVVLFMLILLSWNKDTVPYSVFASGADPGLFVIGICFIVATGGMLKLTYSEGAWHLGAVKRTFLRATLFHVVGSICWILESTPYMGNATTSKGSTPHLLTVVCPAAFSFLHPVWHVCSAQAIMGWIAFLKYHRGLFYGFNVKLRGAWWCPYSVWLEPADANSNPIIRHGRSKIRARASGRRNTYVAPKVLRTSGERKNWRMTWRGASFLDQATSHMRRASLFAQPEHDESAGTGPNAGPSKGNVVKDIEAPAHLEA